ncbi:protein SUPPRESSOR OF MAX2 1 [Salvia miltiorrhiza]|uniref:protein SUPPRESSOR OF MAX2 1 n=1 Tax=Salvia miltiorrhiza TaxID=226208 RepID=UPI0025ACC8E4|nr:protein SUPPRESSOR OF MAX2 1 [Salvia miltiorrhiza]
MRAGLSTIQQTLTPEAASVLNLSIAEASRRNHGQTTPLHVAATLLASPSGFLRQACIRSHPNSSHPLQCRALELCFSVALERLPTAQNMDGSGLEPPISNALMAALKRAQAHQRRGCPEQQQQPLLAVKVELEQLIISILDDPSVSRVMREASFSSPAVKAAIEQSLNSSSAHSHHQHHVAAGNVNFGAGIGPRLLPNPVQLTAPAVAQPNRNVYLNPRLQQGCAGQDGTPKGEELKKVLEIMSRSRKRNPILVGDSEPEAVVKELLRKMVNKEFGGDGNLKNVEVVSMEKGLLSDKNQIASKMEELGGVIEGRIRSGGVILDLGDLKWLVEQQQQQQQVVSETGRAAVAEMKKLLSRFGGESNKLWLIGTATCETYLRCQVYHSSMENDWDLQAVPIASRSPLPALFPRLGTERILSNPVESLNPLKTITSPLPALTKCVLENSGTAQRSSLCPKCSENYEKEQAKLAAIEKSFSEAKQDTQPSLPAWLQNAKLNTADAKTKDESQGKDQGVLSKQKTQELQKKWRDTCLHLHPNFHQNTRPDRTGPPALSMASLYNPNPLSRSPFQPKLQMAKPLGAALQLNTNQAPRQPAELVNSSPTSPVRTDLNLGWKGPDSVPEKVGEDHAKDLLGCISSEPQTKLLDKFSNALDADTYKKLLKGLMEKAWWQAEAASAVASAITRCRLGNGKRRGAGSRGDIWLLFTGPDRVGKKKMASVLAEQMFGVNPVMICLGKRRDNEDSDMNFRGKTAIDRIAEAVRRNPFLVIMLEDIDEADMLVRGSIKRAIERGRLTDSHGREVGLGNAIFIVTGDWSTTNPEAVREGRFVDEEKLASVAGGGWQLGLIVREKSGKRRANWLQDEDRPLKPRREMGAALSLDLNLAAAFVEDEKMDGSNNSSDLTIDHEDELGLLNGHFSVTSVPHDLVSNVDDAIVFKPVSSAFVRREIKKTISVKFSMAVDEKVSIQVEDDVLEKILGGLWHDRSSLEEWMEKVVAPSFDQLKAQLPSGGDRSNSVVRLVVESDSGDRGKRDRNGDWLPSSILV